VAAKSGLDDVLASRRRVNGSTSIDVRQASIDKAGKLGKKPSPQEERVHRHPTG
jgi:hypothetical protein